MPNSKYDLVGKRIFRVDAKSKVTGKTIYPQDIFKEGMVFGKTLRSPVAHGYITKLDISEAEKCPGVLKVFTAKDIPGKNEHGVVFKDHQVFCDKKVRRIGDPIAFVVAETEEQAEAGLEKIVLEIEEIEGIFDPERGMEKDAPEIHDPEVYEGKNNIVYEYTLKTGNVDEAFEECDVIAENEYNVGMVDHAFLQPEAGIAYMEDDKVVVSVSSQYPHFDRFEISEALNIPEDDVRFLNPAIGGAFGAREDVTMQIHLALAAFVLNKPVKAIYDREESFLAHSKRHGIIMRYKTGATKDGKLKAMKCEFIGDTGAYASWAVNVMRKCGVHSTGPYLIPNVDVKSYAVYTNNPFAGAMRGFGATQPPVAHEQQMDILAEKLGMDPIEFRMKNIMRVGSKTATGQELYESVPIDRCIEAVGDYLKGEVNKERALRIAKGPEEAGERNIKYRGLYEDSIISRKKRGIGFGATFYGTGYGNGFPDISVAEMEFARDGKIDLMLEATECGQGSDTAMVQMAAEPFKSGLDIIRHFNCDTDITKDSGTAAASRQTYNTGNAAKMAAERMVEALFDKAAKYMELNSTLGLDIKDGYIFLKFEKDRRISLEELAEKIYTDEEYIEENGHKPLSVESLFIAQTTMMDDENGQGSPYWPYTFGACGVEVEVDMLTGKVEIVKAATAQDVGRAINPQLIEGQMDGGFAMGYGYAIFEELGLRNGAIKNNRFANYLMPTSADMPALKKFIIEDPESTAPYGAKGIGEPVMTYVAPAILNAIYNATGVRIKSLPATPEKVLAAIKAKEAPKKTVEKKEADKEQVTA